MKLLTLSPKDTCPPTFSNGDHKPVCSSTLPNIRRRTFAVWFRHVSLSRNIGISSSENIRSPTARNPSWFSIRGWFFGIGAQKIASSFLKYQGRISNWYCHQSLSMMPPGLLVRWYLNCVYQDDRLTRSRAAASPQRSAIPLISAAAWEALLASYWHHLIQTRHETHLASAHLSDGIRQFDISQYVHFHLHPTQTQCQDSATQKLQG